jgi:hypothetical protein
MRGRPSFADRAPSSVRRGRLIAIALGVAAVLAGCNAHHVALTQRCPAVSHRGAPGLPKMGLTGVALKVEEKCT